MMDYNNLFKDEPYRNIYLLNSLTASMFLVYINDLLNFKTLLLINGPLSHEFKTSKILSFSAVSTSGVDVVMSVNVVLTIYFLPNSCFGGLVERTN